MAIPRTTSLRAFSLALAALCAANVVPRAGRFSGDAMIHLSIAERAASGRWFEFNPGEVTSATTSPAWTALEAALLSLGGYRLALPFVSLLTLCALAGTALLVRGLALRLGASAPAASIGALLFASLPGVASNAPLGMENVVFAFASLAFLLAITAPGRLDRPLHAAALGALLGLCALLRPEGALLSVAVAAALIPPEPITPGRRVGVASVALVALLVVAPALYAHWRITGRWLSGSGLSRVMAARRDPASLHLVGPVWLYLAAPARLLVQLPLAALAFEGARSPGPAPITRRAVLATLAAGFALYSLITGAAHVARVTTWLWALLSALAAVGLSRQLSRASVARWLAVACVAHLAVASAETVTRWRSVSQGRGGLDRATLLHAIEGRRARTDRALRALCSGGCCREGEVPAIAVVEVQRRITFDERLSIASLDGVTAPTRAGGPRVSFDPSTGCPRLDEVLAHPRVLGLLEDPGAQLSRCASSPIARALSGAWERPSMAPPGWRWDAALHGWLRRCASAVQAPSSAASSSASASRTVASRTAARPTSP